MNFYDKFKKDNTKLGFNQENQISEIISDSVLTGIWSCETKKDFKRKTRVKSQVLYVLTRNISSLNRYTETAPELSYLVDFLNQICDSMEAGGNLNLSIDLNKLRYCKTLICYIERQFAESILCTIDAIQDFLVERLDYDENIVFYLPTDQLFCRLKKEYVPVIANSICPWLNEPMQCKHERANFFIFINDRWVGAKKEEFDFIP